MYYFMLRTAEKLKKKIFSNKFLTAEVTQNSNISIKGLL